MKKVLLSFAIVLSSFFLFNLKSSADEISYNFNFSVLPEDFLQKKKAVDDFIKEDSSLGTDYLLVLEKHKSLSPVYYVYIGSSSDIQIIYWNSSLNSQFINKMYRKKFNSDNVLSSAVLNNTSFNLFAQENGYTYYILYSTFNIKTRNDKQNIKLISTDYSKTINMNGIDYFPTIYDMYVEKNGELIPEDPHKEEKEVLESFYSICIEKIKYLADVFVSNYIYLAVIVIFIIIFVFKLVIGRFIC